MNLHSRSLLFIPCTLIMACSTDITVKKQMNEAPVVEVTTPEDKQVFGSLDSIELAALAGDPNGLQDIKSVHWSSSVDGLLMTNEDASLDSDGVSQLATTLSVGLHSVTVRVQDQAGVSASASITVIVEEEEQEPFAEITSPFALDEFPSGQGIQLIGGVDDPNQPANELTAEWFFRHIDETEYNLIDEVEPTSNGTVSLLWDQPSAGQYYVQLVVTDQDQLQTADEIRISVYNPADRDQDGDGWSVNQGDCDDSDDQIHPDALEVCQDLLDNDCSGMIDDKDLDADLHIDHNCIDYAGALPVDDCDDSNSTIYTAANEQLDSLDNDCNGLIDDNTDAYDDDGDGFSELDGDCDDTDPLLNAADLDADGFSTCESDCDDSDSTLTPADLDGDNYSTCDGDCDDDDADLQLDDVDGDGFSTCEDDCDDEDAWLTPEDADNDGYSTCSDDCNDNSAALTPADADGDGYSTCGGDCDDWSSLLHPADVDGDGFSSCDGDCDDNQSGLNLADLDGDNYSTCAGDCDDSDALQTPQDADNDGFSSCDGDCDDTDSTLNPTDNDNDGYSTCAGDCNDNNMWTYPGGYEWADWADNDCDGDVDEGTHLADDDGDGYAEIDGDCDDNNILISPVATESCDGIDNDCDGYIDETDALGCTTYYLDYDGDGYGRNSSLCLCESNVYYDANNTSDCYDGNSRARPNQTTYYGSNRGDGSFDYDCDNVQEKRWTNQAGTCAFFSDGCYADDGWDSVPACGQAGTYKSGCHWDWGCEWSVSVTRVQTCK